MTKGTQNAKERIGREGNWSKSDETANRMVAVRREGDGGEEGGESRCVRERKITLMLHNWGGRLGEMRGLIERDREPGRTGMGRGVCVCVCVCVCVMSVMSVCVRWVLWLYVCTTETSRDEIHDSTENIIVKITQNQSVGQEVEIPDLSVKTADLRDKLPSHSLHVYLLSFSTSLLFCVLHIDCKMYFSVLSCSQWNSTSH